MITPPHRPTLSLDGTWALQRGLRPETVAVQVPGPWTTQIEGGGNSHESVRYSRSFDTPASWRPAERSVLVFGGVNHTASVSLNGVHLGTHVGGWTPFEFDATGALRAGGNELLVEVGYPQRFGDDPHAGPAAGASFAEVAHGKQSWYGTSAGIWQSVTLEQRAAAHLLDVVVRASPADKRVTATALLARPAAGGERLRLSVWHDEAAADSEPLSSTTLPLAGGTVELEIATTLDAVRLWSPADPQLYRVAVSVLGQAETAPDDSAPSGSVPADSAPAAFAPAADTVVCATGFRTIETRGGEVVLNGEAIEIRAVLDQDYHPGSSTIPESDEALERLFAEARRLGFNMLRCHIKRPDRRYYELADRMGMLVWAELPSWLNMTARAADDGARLLERLIDLDGHHPSIVIWTVINESWCIDLRDAGQRAWLRSTFEAAKTRSPHTLVVDNSACEPNFHIKSDLDDYHVYRGIPESRVAWDEKIAEFAGRPAWTYSPHGDAERSREEPLLLSEYGNWGLPVARDQYGSAGAEPWWFAAGANWAFGAAEGTGLFQRFAELGLDQVFGSWEALVDGLQHAQMVANRYQTGSIRSHGDIAGYVLTQLSDVQWEANGLLDMNRRPKAYNDDFALANQELAVVLRPERYSGVPGEAIDAALSLVPPRPLARWAGASGELRLFVAGERVHSAAVALDERTTSRHSVVLPARSGEAEFAAELWHDGALLARDAATIVVVDDAPVALDGEIWAADEELLGWLDRLGFSARLLDDRRPGAAADDDAAPAGLPARAGLVVTRCFGPAAQAHARAGGRVLLLAETQDAFGDGFTFLPQATLGPRDGDGDWVPRQEWLRRDGAFSALPGAPLLGIAYENLLGDLVMSGLPAPMRPGRVFSGIFSGWLRNTATTTATVAWSAGELTATTFRVREQAAIDPLARTLGRALVAHAARTA